MLPWKSIIFIQPDTHRPIYLQISDAFIKEISAGRLHAGHKLPGSRKMAELLGLNRKTIIQAYEELDAQGWIQTRSSSGTFVSDDLPVNTYNALDPLNQAVDQFEIPEINSFDYIPNSKNEAKNEIIVDGGSPDHRLAPMDWIYRESRSIINSHFV